MTFFKVHQPRNANVICSKTINKVSKFFKENEIKVTNLHCKFKTHFKNNAEEEHFSVSFRGSTPLFLLKALCMYITMMKCFLSSRFSAHLLFGVFEHCRYCAYASIKSVVVRGILWLVTVGLLCFSHGVYAHHLTLEFTKN